MKLSENKKTIYIGTASWAIPNDYRDQFPQANSILERYAKKLNAVEINSSFYRDHKPETYKKWADIVPEGFRFSVKLSRYFTQEKRLKESGTKLKEVLSGILQLGKNLGVLLIQLPPSLEFEKSVAEQFFKALRKIFNLPVVLEPRHKSWGTKEALKVLNHFDIGKVHADPELVPVKKFKSRVEYYRLHGSPKIYKSKYSVSFLKQLHKKINNPDLETWVIFDNTTFGFATENALKLKSLFSAKEK